MLMASKSDYEGQCGKDLKVDQALDADAADTLQVAMARDTGNKRGEDQRSDDGLDQAQEDVAEDTQRDRKSRSIEAQFGSHDHGDKDPRE